MKTEVPWPFGSQPTEIPATDEAEHLELTPTGLSESVVEGRRWRYRWMLPALLALGSIALINALAQIDTLR